MEAPGTDPHVPGPRARETRVADYWWLLAVTALAHGLVLLCDGPVWDGWLIQSWLQNGQWSYLQRWMQQAGAGIFVYLHWPFFQIGGSGWSYCLAGFLLLLPVGCLCY